MVNASPDRGAYKTDNYIGQRPKVSMASARLATIIVADLLMTRLLYPSLFFLAVHVVFLALVATVILFN